MEVDEEGPPPPSSSSSTQQRAAAAGAALPPAAARKEVKDTSSLSSFAKKLLIKRTGPAPVSCGAGSENGQAVQASISTSGWRLRWCHPSCL